MLSIALIALALAIVDFVRKVRYTREELEEVNYQLECAVFDEGMSQFHMDHARSVSTFQHAESRNETARRDMDRLQVEKQRLNVLLSNPWRLLFLRPIPPRVLSGGHSQLR